MIRDREKIIEPDMTDAGVPGEMPPTRPRISLLGIANMALRRRRLFVILPLIAFIVGTVRSIKNFDPTVRFAATSKFFTKSGGSSGGGGSTGLVGALLGQPSSGGGDLWNAILRSTDFTRELAAAKFRVRGTDADSVKVQEGTIARLHGFPGDSIAELKQGVSLLKSGRIGIRLGSDIGGLVTLTTVANTQDLAVQLNYRVLEMLERYDTRLRRNNISVERRFIEERMLVASDQLARAQSDLTRFLESNRQYSSPQLQVEHGRLVGRVGLYQGIYSSMASTIEQQRIEEARNTPVITMFDRPENEVTASIPTRPQTEGLFGLMLGFIAAVLIVFGAEFLKQVPAHDPEEYQQFRRLWGSLTSGVTPRRVREWWQRRRRSKDGHGVLPPADTTVSAPDRATSTAGRGGA